MAGKAYKIRKRCKIIDFAIRLWAESVALMTVVKTEIIQKQLPG
jgi:hypothetical protein